MNRFDYIVVMRNENTTYRLGATLFLLIVLALTKRKTVDSSPTHSGLP